jgi:hypothetical protein
MPSNNSSQKQNNFFQSDSNIFTFAKNIKQPQTQQNDRKQIAPLTYAYQNTDEPLFMMDYD